MGHVKGWQRSGNFGHDQPILGKIGAGTNIPELEFFCLVNHATFQELRNGRFSPNLVTKHIFVSRCGIRRHFRKFSLYCLFAPKSEIENRSNTHLTQSRLQFMWCNAEIYCLLHVVVQRPGSFWGWSAFLYDVRLRSYGASKLPNFQILASFPRTKPLKHTFRWPAYSPGVTQQNASDFSMW